MGLIQICIKLLKEVFTTQDQVMKQSSVISVLKGNFKGQTLTAITAFIAIRLNVIYCSISYTLL